MIVYLINPHTNIQSSVHRFRHYVFGSTLTEVALAPELLRPSRTNSYLLSIVASLILLLGGVVPINDVFDIVSQRLDLAQPVPQVRPIAPEGVVLRVLEEAFKVYEGVLDALEVIAEAAAQLRLALHDADDLVDLPSDLVHRRGDEHLGADHGWTGRRPVGRGQRGKGRRGRRE